MATTIPNSIPPSFAGEFRHAIDNKNRLTIPAKWRFAEDVELYLVPKALKKCVAVLPRAEMERILAIADSYPPEERSHFLDGLGRNVRQATLDKAGRITLPLDLCKRAGLAGEVMLSGAMNTFNIWTLADFAAETAAGEASTQSLLRKLGL